MQKTDYQPKLITKDFEGIINLIANSFFGDVHFSCNFFMGKVPFPAMLKDLSHFRWQERHFLVDQFLQEINPDAVVSDCCTVVNYPLVKIFVFLLDGLMCHNIQDLVS